MVGERRAPGVQNRGDADVGAQMLGIGRDGYQCLGRGLEQEIVDQCLVLVGDVGDGGRQGEDHMAVGHRQEFGLAFGEPLLCGRTLALRAVPGRPLALSWKPCRRSEPYRASGLVLWHEAANLKCSSMSALRVRSGLYMLNLSSSGCDPQRSAPGSWQRIGGESPSWGKV